MQKKESRKVYFIVILFLFHYLLISTCIYAQPNSLLPNIDTDKGLSQNSVLTIHQDKHGFLWLGTRDGLTMYDGNNTEVFKNIIEDNNSIGGNIINDIYPAENNNLWIAHNKGISFFNRVNKKFTNYTLDHIATANNEILCITRINSELWISGTNGVYIFDEKNKKFFSAAARYKEVDNIFVSEIEKHPVKNEVWIGTAQNKIIVLNLGTKTTYNIVLDKAANTNVRVEDILFHENGNTYIATYSHGLYELDKNNTLQNHWWSKASGRNYFTIDRIRELVKDKNGKIWIGGFEGLSLLNTHTKTIDDGYLRYSFERAPYYSVRSLLEDKNGTIWIGTYHNGLIFYDPYLFRFSYKTLYSENRESQETHIISSFAQIQNNNIIVGTESGDLIEYDSNFIQKNSKRLLNDQKAPTVIKTLYFDIRNNHLYIGTLNDGVYVSKNGVVQHIPETKQLGVINYFSPYEKDKLWILSDKSGGVSLYNLQSRQLIENNITTAIRKKINKGKGKHILSVSPQDNQFLIASHQTGLHLFNSSNNQITSIASTVKDINYIIKKDDKYYVCTNGQGVLVLDSQFNILSQLTTNNGLQNNTVFQAIATPDNGIWFITLNGLSKLYNNTISNFDARNGLPLDEINNAFLFYKNNTIVVGGKNRFAFFNPEKVYSNPYKPNIILKDIRISNKSIAQTKGFEHYDISQLNKLILKNNQTTLTFLFTGLNYLMPENNTYEYILEGFEEKWNKVGHQGIAHYSFIPAGNYTLKIKAFNNDGLSGNNIMHLPIKILLPFWISWPAILLYLALIVLALYLWKRNTLKYAKLKHNLHLNELEKKRMNEMHELKTKLFADISHEIRTPLSLIIGPVDEVIERNKVEIKDRKKLESVQYHSKYLLRLINQLLKIDRIEKKKEKENKQPLHIIRYLKSIDAAYKPVAESNNINWNIDTKELNDVVLMIDKDNLDTILINLLSNAFKFTKAGDAITLKTTFIADEPDKNKLTFHIMDTGIGIHQDDIVYIFDRYFKTSQNLKTGTGIGLSLVKEIVTGLMNGSIVVKSEVGKGSTFTVELNNIQTIQNQQIDNEVNKFLLPFEFATKEETIIQSYNSTFKDDNAKILIIEDNISLLNFLIEDLNKKYSIFPTTSVEDAEIVLEENDIDLIISDIMLPGKNGDVLCAEVKSNIKTSHIPIILLTAIADDNTKIKGLEQGADDYIFKPFNLKELSLKVNNILKQRSRWRQLYNYQTLNTNDKATIEKKYNSYDEELLKSIDNYIEKNIDNPELTVEDISNEVALSRTHLFRKIKKLTGLSPSLYIRNVRLKKAKEILEKQDIRIQELADKLGFNDQNYFSKCFKEAYGFSPTDIRNKAL